VEITQKGLDSSGQRLRRVVFMDNLDAHKASVDTMRMLQNADIWVCFLPPNTTHFTAPLDDCVFATLRDALINELSQVRWIATKSVEHVVKMLTAVQTALQKALKPSLIIASYRHCGLVPFDENLIITRAERNVGVVPTRPRSLPKGVMRAAAAAKRVIDRNRPLVTGDKFALVPVPDKDAVYTAQDLIDAAQRKKEAGEAKNAAAADKERVQTETKREKARKKLIAKGEALLKKKAVRVERLVKSVASKWLRAARAAHTAKARDADMRRRVANVCSRCGAHYTVALKDQAWWTCEVCNAFSVCGKHDDSREVVEEHEASCTGRIPGASLRQSV
jgi:hypothetical protein